ncbi:MAG: FMN-binding negative transcriptional regulator [Candidatus Acidiferrales bacterium]
MLRTAFDQPLHDTEWQEFLAAQRFGQLIATGAARPYPVVTPTHFTYARDGELEMHLHRSNPVFGAIRENSLVTFSVIDAATFVPSTWNHEPGEDAASSAPTSYYAAAQIHGRACLVEDPTELSALLNRQVASFFDPQDRPDEVSPGHPVFGDALRIIIGIRITVGHVLAKFKFGGNRSVGQRIRIAQNLTQRRLSGDAEAAHHLLRRLIVSRAFRESESDSAR